VNTWRSRDFEYNIVTKVTAGETEVAYARRRSARAQDTGFRDCAPGSREPGALVPALLLPEVSAAVSRGRRDEVLARDFALALARLPHLIMIPLDETLARQAMDVAAGYRLRGSEAVYAAVALRFGTTLVTLDREQKERLGSVTTACQPARALDLR